MRTLVVGDIHGAHKALVQVLERANFNPHKDLLISVGDVADGWAEVKDCVDLLIQNKAIVCMGNHDEFFRKYLQTGLLEPIWTSQGGKATLESYSDGIPESHDKFFRTLVPFHYIPEKDYVFVHAGWRPHTHRVFDVPVSDEFWWARSFWEKAKRTGTKAEPFTPHQKVFIGHTALSEDRPLKYREVWNIDTGAGWNGKLTLMDADTEEYWQSDLVKELYPQYAGRR